MSKMLSSVEANESDVVPWRGEGVRALRMSQCRVQKNLEIAQQLGECGHRLFGLQDQSLSLQAGKIIGIGVGQQQVITIVLAPI